MKIFHLGYLLLLDSLDMPDDEYGTRSARLLAQMRDQGYETSLDLVSRKGDPRYQPLVLPALRHLDYLVINELEAGEFSGLEMRDENDAPHIAHIAEAASQLLAAGVRQRVVIHCPEGAWGLTPDDEGRWIPSGCWSGKRLSAASGRVMPSAQASYTAAMKRCRWSRVFIWPMPARGQACWLRTPLMGQKRWPSCSCLLKRIFKPLSRCETHRQQRRSPAPGRF